MEEILEGVSDQVLRTRISLLLAELSSCRAQLLALRHLANTTAVLDLRESNKLPSAPPAEAPRLHLTLQEVTALEKSIGQENLDHWGWTKAPNGRVTSESGQIVFRAGFVQAVEKVVAFCGI